MNCRSTLSVVVCTFNRHELLGNLLSHLLANKEDDVRIIVVDNSDSSTAIADNEQLVSDLADVKLVRSEPGKLSAARNAGLKACETNCIAFIDDDAKPCQRWTHEIKHSFNSSEENIAAVGGPIIPIWEGMPPAWLSPQLLGPLTVLDLGETTRTLGQNEHVYGANMAFRVDAVKDAGGFNEDLGRAGSKLLLSNEEIELQDQLRENGLNVLYNPNMSVHHTVHKDRLNQQWFFRRMVWQAISETLGKKAMSADMLVHNQRYLRQVSEELGFANIAHNLLAHTEDREVFERRVYFIYSLLKQIMNIEVAEKLLGKSSA